ncbi:Hpt domain-containing protein [Actimicrobium antarcticum]|uniref:histidine kinase n=1 Tax=Actimicrobium antarcticum TaxID=1051899 RepID=A0ABP7TBJ8_9BURK
MSSQNSISAPGVRDNFDAGSLSWVMGEIREALNRSLGAIGDALAQDADERSTTLRHAKLYVHQAHGALQIVDIDGVTMITDTVEDILVRMESGQVALTADAVQTIESAYQALLAYLDELLNGAAHQPVRLFPYYQALLELRSAERIHPADLFFPNLAGQPELPVAAVAATPGIDQEPVNYAQLRKRFEMALLPFLKQSDASAQAGSVSAMLAIIGDIEQAQTNPQSRNFWWVLRSFAEGVGAGQIPAERYVKQLFARINLQIRRLSEGSSSIAERLLRDALFFIARIEQPSALAQQVRTTYELDGLVPQDYASRRYAQVDTASLAQAKDSLAKAKENWSKIAVGEASFAESYEAEMRRLMEAGSTLGSVPLSKLLRELNGIARHAAYSHPGDRLSLEMAASLLFVEHALANIRNLDGNFPLRADALTARLLSMVAGDEPIDAGDWLDDMSRQAQQRQTLSVLASEMQSSLRQVEKGLEDYFRDPGRRAGLKPLSPILHQISGALAVLDQDEAMRAVQHIEATVHAFSEAADQAPDASEFSDVAQNIGALSFFIETLQLHPDAAKGRFGFDQEKGVFRANLTEKKRVSERTPTHAEVLTAMPDDGSSASMAAAPQAAVSGQSEPPALSTVEQEMQLHQQQSVDLAVALTEHPDNPALQEKLREVLQQVQRDARLLDNPEAGARAAAAITLLAQPDFAATDVAFARMFALPAPAHSVAPQQTEAAIDAELLEIFLGEAQEVLAVVRETTPLSRSDRHDPRHLVTLRRAFHTLKGSSRMVGLNAFGDAAWSVEQVLNQFVADEKPASEHLCGLLDQAEILLNGWSDDLQQTGSSDRDAQPLMAAAQRLMDGEPFDPPASLMPEVAAESALPSNTAVDLGVDEVIEGLPVLDEVQEAALSLDVAPDSETVAYMASPVLPSESLVGLPGLPADDAADLDESDTGSGIDTDADADSANDIPELTVEETRAPFLAPAETAVSSAAVLHFPGTGATEFRHDDTIKRIGNIDISVPLHNIYLAETDDLVRILSNDIAEWRHETERPVSIQAVHAVHSLAGSSATVGFRAVQEVAHALENVLQLLARRPVPLTVADYDLMEHSVLTMKVMLQEFALGDLPLHEPVQVNLLRVLLQDLEQRTEHVTTVRSDDVMPVGEDADLSVTSGPFAYAADVPAPTANEVVAFDEPELATTFDANADPALRIVDELDADLLPIFMEEGRDMLPQMGAALRAWQAALSSTALPQSILRLLHTIKGSARMAGAMQLGQYMHETETRIEQILHAGAPDHRAIDALLARHDQGLYLFELLQNPGAELPAIEPQAALHSSADADLPLRPALVELASVMPVRTAGFTGQMPASTTPAAAVPMVRVRADILDRLVNQAGEVSISRSRLETDVDTLRLSLGELTDNVARLREQLREIEMQAETQITSRMANSPDREFDPLEFDRFTRLQEITRMMAESVSDVATVQQSLTRTVDGASAGLVAQARLTRDLQQDLMRVRMVQFASISERLYRVTRQASKEVDKRVNLDIRGSAVEIDRSVLEKMAGPFEHLLRNAIVHGIESRDERLAAGKNETGELRIEIRQDGNEVVLQFSDDGRGLDLQRIRSKAVATGLLADGREVADAELTDLIFNPGFSTAHEVTELAGRGVGMDVVRSEASSLGGRVAIQSEAGKGAQFTIHLPLTLAVTQVVILRTGDKIYAVPSVLVEQVQQLKASALANAYNDGAVMWQGQRVPLFYLPALLGDRQSVPVAQQYSPLVILKSGIERVALHVDEVQGNREVVVKNIGPQLARMVGIAGATVLGSGEIVLIVNPLPLAQRAVLDQARRPASLAAQAGMGAVAETGDAGAPAVADAVQGLRTQSIVMVVDDSLTVRRVTQRLLTREGFQVVLAKDGIDALEQLQAITPDVMLVDIEMPRMDGFDLTRNVRGDERTRHIPIIMITSRTAAKHRNYALELGVNEYFGKPYQEADLLHAIRGFLPARVAPD